MSPKKANNSGLINFSSSINISRMRTIAPAPIQTPPKAKVSHQLISETFSSSSEASRVLNGDGGEREREPSKMIERQSEEPIYTPMMNGGGDGDNRPAKNDMTPKTETTITTTTPTNDATGLSKVDGDTSVPDDTPTISPTEEGPHLTSTRTTFSDAFNIPDTNDNNISRPPILPRRSSISSSSTNTGNRRHIFRTLYEPTYQDSALSRNQERQNTQETPVRDLPQSSPSHPPPGPPLPSVISLPPPTSHSAASSSSHKDDCGNNDDRLDRLLNAPSDLSTTNSKSDQKSIPLSSLNINDLDISSYSSNGGGGGDSDAKTEKSTISRNLALGLRHDPEKRPALTSILRNSKENLLETEKKEKKPTNETEGCLPTFNLKTITESFTRRSIIPKSSSDSCLDSFKAQIQMANTTSTPAVAAAIATPVDIPITFQSSYLFHQTNKHLKMKRTDDRFDSSSTLSSNQTMTRHISHEEIGRKKTIRFDPRIWVHEIPIPPVEKMWYNASDMNRFKCEAILRIRKWSVEKSRRGSKNSQTMISTGTGRIVSVERQTAPSSDDDLASAVDRSKKVIYTNPALSCEEDEDDDEEVIALANKLSLRESGLVDEFKSILIVDSHDIFLTLLGKSFKKMLPHIHITTACTVEQASKAIEKANLMHKANKTEEYSHGFDIILIEERLKPHLQPKGHCNGGQINWNGSSLIAKIKKETESTLFFRRDTRRHPLVIGISAYLDHDRQRLEASGSDLVWGKPPPAMDNQLRMSLLKKIMQKRNRPNIDQMF